VNQSWQEGEQVLEGLKAYNFSVRYTTEFKPKNGDEIAFEVEGDDGYKLFIDGTEVLNAWTRNRWGAKSYKLKALAGKNYRIVLEYYQGEGKANISLRTGKFVKSDLKALARRVRSADAIIYVGGISPQLEGEEMKVNEPGFDGGDRSTILLPKVQTETMKALKTTGKPVIFVMMTGSAIATPWEAENIPAIVNAWYGGQSAGTAVADVVFGDYNPAGRLPVTFYRSDGDLPDFNSYDMTNRTYRYFHGQPLWSFGHGLSYTTFQYDQPQVPSTYKVNQAMTVKVRVTNVGKRDGEEVVQLYVSHIDSKHKTPIRALKGFSRIFLKSGESKSVTFRLRPQDLAVVDAEGSLRFEAGRISIAMGGGQNFTPSATNKNVVETTTELTN
jgi:beta-glucosidase